MGPRRDCTWILGLSGFRVVTINEAEDRRLTIRIERRGVRRYTCSGCGRCTGRVPRVCRVLRDPHRAHLLRRWKTVRGSKRRELQTLFANRRLFKAYVLREQPDRLWTYKTRPGVLNFLNGWINALRWQRLPEMDRLGEFLFRHLDGIAVMRSPRALRRGRVD